MNLSLNAQRWLSELSFQEAVPIDYLLEDLGSIGLCLVVELPLPVGFIECASCQELLDINSEDCTNTHCNKCGGEIK